MKKDMKKALAGKGEGKSFSFCTLLVVKEQEGSMQKVWKNLVSFAKLEAIIVVGQ